MSEIITDIPGNFTLLTILDQLINYGLGDSIPMPIMLSNNWTWWGEAFDELEIALPGLIFTSHGFASHPATGLDVFYTRIDLNMSFIIFELLDDALSPIFSDPEDYNNWILRWGNITVESYAHEHSSVLLEGRLTMNVTANLDNMQEIFEEMYATSPDQDILVLINILKDLPRPDLISVSMVMAEFKYAGVYLVGGPTPPVDLALLGFGLAIGITAAGIIVIAGCGVGYYFLYHKPRVLRVKFKF